MVIAKKYQNIISFIVIVFVLILGLILYFVNVDKLAITVIYSISLVLVSIVILSTFDNMILASRLFLLFIVGAYPLAIKLMDENLYFSVFEFNTQTLDIATTMYALTLIAVPASYIGWWVGRRIGFKSDSNLDVGSSPSQEYYKCIFYLCAFFAILSGYLIVSSSTGTILDSAYGAGTEGDPVIGSASAIGGVALSVMFYCALVLRKKAYLAITMVVALYLLIWCQILRGLRQDVVGVVFSFIVLFLIVKTGNIAIKIKYILYLLPLMILLELWGLIRTGLSLFLAGEIGLDELFDMGLGNAATMSDVVYSGTLGPITTTFANTVYLIKDNSLSFIYGQGYLDFILRTPPQFLYPDRPKDYALMFPDYGLSSGGGFFELAEAYLNFGVFGAFLMPFLISVSISFIYFRAQKSSGIFYVFALSSILCVWLRGAWYQTFAYYKSFISASLLFFVVHVIATIILENRKSAKVV